MHLDSNSMFDIINDKNLKIKHQNRYKLQSIFQEQHLTRSQVDKDGTKTIKKNLRIIKFISDNMKQVLRERYNATR